jgi:hypothetical protein
MVNTGPERSGSFAWNLFLDTISDSDIQRVKDADKSVLVDNATHKIMVAKLYAQILVDLGLVEW